MHVITHTRIIEAMQKWPQAETALDGWYRTIKANDPKDFAEMKHLFQRSIKLESSMYSILAGTRSDLLQS